MTSQFDSDLKELIHSFSKGVTSRRDMLRVGVIAAGAVATAKMTVACGGGDDDEEAAEPTAAADAPTTVAATAPAASTSPAEQSTQAPSSDAETGAEVGIPWPTFGVGVVVDPHRAPNWGPFWFMLPFAYGGLVQYDENAIVKPDLAESWEVSNGGLTYTFKIRPDAKFASGRDVVADDFVYSWKRSIHPDNPSPMAHFMEHLKGYQAYIDGEATELEGVRVVDPKTIEVTLSRPYNFFLSYLATYTWFVVDKEAVEQYGDDFASHPSGTGPWTITKIDPQLVVEMVPNEHYYGGVNQSIAKLKFHVLVGPTADTTALNLYKSDELAFVSIPIALMDAVKNDTTLSGEMKKIWPTGSTRSLAMNFAAEPFDDVRVRRAFGHAIDRETFSKVIWRETWLPTDVYTPPIIEKTDPGYEPPHDVAPEFDPEKGKQLLADAGYPNGEGLPEIRFYEASEDASDEINRWRAFLDMFKEHLGVEIVHDTSMTADQIDKLRTERGGLQMEVWWWGIITETPQLMSEVFRTDSPYMVSTFNWNYDLPATGEYTPGEDAKKFDELMAQADVEQDIDTMNELYRQGEELVLKNAVYVPIANLVTYVLIKPWIKNMRLESWPFGNPARFEPDVFIEGRRA